MKKLLIALTIISTLLISCTESSSVVKKVSIVPQPLSVEVSDGSFVIKGNQTIGLSDSSLTDAASYLTKILSSTGYNFSIKEGEGDINLELTDIESKTEGAYTLQVEKKRVTIKANEYKGIINAITTLRQLLPVEIESKQVVNNFGWALPLVSITDEPQYEWRGLMLDVSRHFYTKDEVLEFIDLLALYKMNKFHWHLTDDQGWRIEIKKYPLLTEKGGWREFNSQDRDCMRLEKEQSNSDFALPEDRIKIVEGDTLYGGFYTQEDIKEIVSYAEKLAIDIIPEIDMPGHCLVALENYDNLSCFNKTGWGSVFSSPLCPGKESAMNFAKDVYKEIFELFPYEYVHLGADEVDMSNWKSCKDCQKMMKAHSLKDVHALHAWFVKSMESYFNENGKKIIGWDEIIEGDVSPTATVAWWRDWVPAAKQATELGHEVILCPTSYFYFDYGQNDRTIESLYKGDVTTKLNSEQKKLIKGYQANIWTERIPSRERMQYMAYPRALAVAEKAWSSAENQSWDSFNIRLADQWDRLSALGVNYRIDRLAKDIDRSVFIDSFTVTFDCLDKNAVIRYTEDGTTPTSNSTLYAGPFEINESKDFIVGTFHPSANRSDIHKIKITKDNYHDGVSKDVELHSLKVEFWDNFRGKKAAEITDTPSGSLMDMKSFSLPEVIERHFALRYSGFFKIPSDDIYTFEILSRDGAVLKISDNIVVDNDGRHPALTKRGQAALKAGIHPLELRFFGTKVAELSVKVYNSKGEELEVEDLIY